MPKFVAPRDGGALDALILRKAETPEGFAHPDAGPRASNALERCRHLVADGQLFRSAPTKVLVRYFTTASAAAEFKRLALQQRAASAMPPNFKKPLAKLPSTAAKVIMPPGVKVDVRPCQPYQPLVLASVLRECTMGTARLGCRATPQTT